MNILSIDCSNGLMLSLFADKKQYNYFNAEQKKQSDDLLVQIDKLLIEAKLSVKNIDVIAVCVGPGSFTGIRVAISTAKGLAIGSRAKVVTFSSFETIEDLPDNNYGVIVDGFGTNYYYYFKKFGRIFEGCNTPDKIEKLADGITVFTLSASAAEKITNFVLKTANYSSKKVIEEKIALNKFVLTNQIEPVYLRESQAEIERIKHGN
ncbi:MAG: tRNA (adenosine(37)-N6)-threonylcarbamoyltransferase complex dimerization subunit type 1 TsaB [Clostridia bacterium]|nr:tRNA (adenosine(37)-N6)-threonylcarbamoyltransferase complex dimerization subunit type 1 TsaB [Clostridia bacterium]